MSAQKTPEEIIKGIEQDFLHMPYNKYVWMRLEFALICNDELEALILRIVEYSIEGQRLAWVREATDLASQGKPVPPEPQWWCSFSYRQFMSYLYGVVKNEKTIIKKLDSLIHKKQFLLRRVDPEKPYGSPQYTINKQVVQDKLNGLPKKLPTLKEVAEYHSRNAQPVPDNGTPNNEENDPYQLVVPPVPASGTPRTTTGDSPVPASGGDPYQLVVPNKNNKTITESEEEEQEENAHVSHDTHATLSSSNSSPSLFSQYDLLLAYRDNQLEHLYECEKAAMVNMSQKLSPNRAGELAAAKLSVQLCAQYVRFKDEVDALARSAQEIAPEDEALYDWLVDHWNVRADLTTLSGTRTLILDEDMYASLNVPSSEQREATQPLTAEDETVTPPTPKNGSQAQGEQVPPTAQSVGQPSKQTELLIVESDTGKTSSSKGNKGSQANNTAKKPTPGADEKALRKQVQQWIDEKRGYRLYGSGTKEQIFSEQNAVNMFALKLLNEQQGNHEEGCTWDELDYLWKVVRTKDPYWSKDENRSRVGGYALQQQFATVVLGKYRPAKLKQMRNQNAAQGATQTGTNMASAVQEHRQMSDLERRNAELRAKYGQKQIS